MKISERIIELKIYELRVLVICLNEHNIKNWLIIAYHLVN